MSETTPDEESLTIASPDFTPDEVRRLGTWYTQVVRSHDVCGGVGSALQPSGDFGECACRRAYHRIRQLIFARIPERFWCPPTEQALNVSGSLRKRTLPVPVLIQGATFSGKTTLLAGVGRDLLEAGSFVFYFQADEAGMIDRSESLAGRLRASRVVLLDDVDRALDQGLIDRLVRQQHNSGADVCMTATSDIRSAWLRVFSISGSVVKVREQTVVSRLDPVEHLGA